MRAYWSLLLLPGIHGQSHMQKKNGREERRRRGRYKKIHAQFKTQDNRGKTEIKGTCHICGKNLASTHGFFIEAPILKQLQTFFEFLEVSLFERMTPHSFFFFDSYVTVRGHSGHDLFA